MPTKLDELEIRRRAHDIDGKSPSEYHGVGVGDALDELLISLRFADVNRELAKRLNSFLAGTIEELSDMSRLRPGRRYARRSFRRQNAAFRRQYCRESLEKSGPA